MSQHTGTLLEWLAITDALARGFRVSRPLNGFAPYDLILDDGTHLFRVEVKARHMRHRAQLGVKCDGLITVDPRNTIEWFWTPNMAPVSQPHGHTSTYDLVLDDGTRLLRASVLGVGRESNAFVMQLAITDALTKGFRVSRPLDRRVRERGVLEGGH